jgi:hypothetical protein
MRLAAGYAIGHSTIMNMDGVGIDGSRSINGNIMSMSGKKVSFGQGPSLRIAGGYNFTGNIGVEVGVHGVISPTYSYQENDQQYSFVDQSTTANGPYYIVPAVVFSMGSQWRFFGRAGLGLPLSQKVKQEVTTNVPSLKQKIKINSDIVCHFQPAIEGSLGLSHPLNKNIALQAELSLISRTAYAKRSELTGAELNGYDVLSQIPIAYRVTEYDKEASIDFTASNTFGNSLTFPVAFSSLGLNLGITYSFN